VVLAGIREVGKSGYAPVETTKLLHPRRFLPQGAGVRCLTALSSRANDLPDGKLSVK
jgi:hypothetical protein